MTMADIKAAIAPGTSKANPRLLTLVLLTPANAEVKVGEARNHATIRYPASYEAAVAAALKAFGNYLPPSVDGARVEMLWSVADNDGTLVWSVFDPADWSLVMEEAAGKVMGIREKPRPGPSGRASAEAELDTIDATPFVIGNIIASYGQYKDGSIKWSPVQLTETPTLGPTIIRPKTYSEAIRLIKETAQKDRKLASFRDMDLTGMTFKFHSFTSSRGGKLTTDSWVDFPEIAYTDDRFWRLGVPEVFQILGFTLHEVSPLQGKALDS